MKTATLITTIIFILSFAALGVCWDYYVDAVNGSDIIPDKIGWGLSPDKPFKTITKASHAMEDTMTDVPPPTIYVAPGLYNMELGEVFPLLISSKPNLIGANRINTIIDASGSGETAIIFQGNRIEGFTITGGSAPGNDFDSRGGGIFVESGYYSFIKKCIIKDNEAFYGGGIYTTEGIIIEDCIIADNYSKTSGGGLYISSHYRTDYPSSWIRSTIFDNNRAGISGAGLYCDSTSPLLADCSITNNSIPDSTNWETYGAGIYSRNGSRMFINRCKIKSNIVHDFGGGIFTSESIATIVNSQICDNTAIEHDGGGVFCDGGLTKIFNSLIAVNSTSERGAGIYSNRYSRVYVGNCTISDNFSPIAAGIFNDSHSHLEFHNSIMWNCGDKPIDGNGYGNVDDDNFGIDPMFVIGPRGEYYLSQVAAGQEADSPYLDNGYPMDLDFPDEIALSYGTTSTNGLLDIGKQHRFDAGYHYLAHIDFSLHLDPDYKSYSWYVPVDLLLNFDKVGQARTVDIYFVMIDDKGIIHSAPTWEKGLSPAMTNVILPDNMKFHDMIVRKLNMIDYFGSALMSPPYDPGPEVTYTYAIAATIAGTTELISNFETIEFTTTLRP